MPRYQLYQPFDWEFYTKYYNDLKNLNESQARAHWNRYGRKERRYYNAAVAIKNEAPDFDYKFYTTHYEDLKDLGEYDAYNHWLFYGKNEVCRFCNYIEWNQRTITIKKRCRPPLKKICIVQPIFCPDEEHLNKNLRSLESQIVLINEKCDFFYSGWCKEVAYWEKIDKIISKYNPRKYIKQDKNYGKSYNVNKLLEDVSENDYDLMLTMDSDIIFKANIDYIKEIDIIQQDIVNFGLLGLNLEVHNVHQLQAPVKNLQLANHIICCNALNSGIGGGCLFIDFKVWKKINGYRVMGVYCSDDAVLLQDVYSLRKCIGLVKTLYVIHPYTANRFYDDWKARTLAKKDIQRYTISSERHQKEIEKCDTFWNKPV